MNKKILQRIATETGVSNLSDILSAMSGADLHSLLLAVIKRRIEALEPISLGQPSPVTLACSLDGRLLNSVELDAYDSAPAFSAVELSPLSPLGAVNVLTGLDQANVLSSIRAFECASDPTIGLSLECARRRKGVQERSTQLHLCTNHRVVRFPQPKTPGFTSHFKLFSMVSAGRDSGSFSFEMEALKAHIQAYLTMMSSLNESGLNRAGLGPVEFQLDKIVVELSDTTIVGHLCDRHQVDREQIRSKVRAHNHESAVELLSPFSSETWPRDLPLENFNLSIAPCDFSRTLQKRLQLLNDEVRLALLKQFPSVSIEFNLRRLTGLSYYQGPCFHIKASNKEGQQFMLADGGFVDWTRVLLADKKERLMTSAIGTELLCRVFSRVISEV